MLSFVWCVVRFAFLHVVVAISLFVLFLACIVQWGSLNFGVGRSVVCLSVLYGLFLMPMFAGIFL